MLRITDAVVKYGPAVAVDSVSLSVGDGQMVALVGPNGAGKTSLVRAILGLEALDSGSIDIDGSVALVPEGRQLFPELTVEDNLRLGAWRLRQRDVGPVFELFPDLERMRKQKAGTLSGGQQQMVSIGRALMAQPKLLVIDELSLGLAPIIVSELAGYLRELNRTTGVAVLLIEQEVKLAFELCERAYVLEAGRIALEGTTVELRNSDVVREVYLGATIDVESQKSEPA